MPQSLDYMPQTYRRATPIWVPMAGGLGVVAGGVAAIGWLSGHWDRGLLGFGAAAGVLWVAQSLFIWRRGGIRECRIEGDVLSFRCFGEKEYTSILIADIKEVVDVDSVTESKFCEIVVRGRGRTLADANVFNPRREFQAALVKVNPAVLFSSRESNRCFACGGNLNGIFLEGRCPHCHHALPRYGKWV